MGVAGARMVGMGMRDQRAINGSHRVNEEAARVTPQAFRAGNKYGVGDHGIVAGCAADPRGSSHFSFMLRSERSEPRSTGKMHLTMRVMNILDVGRTGAIMREQYMNL
jgi:hypothetical protein